MTAGKGDAGAAGRWEPVIGLEVHAQLLTDTKIFCGCRARYGAPPNSQVCPVCLGHPGVLPVLNRKVVDLGLRVALAIGARIDRASRFARKNYFYPDLPKGYQISQYERPLCTGGSLGFRMGDAGRTLRFHRIHLEEDAGKLMHPERGETVTRVDLNRCGTPLLEIVTEPDIESPEAAHAVLGRLRQLLLYLEVCDGNMEEGSLRCDANVSVRPRGRSGLGTRTEIKNLNSFRNVERGLAHEIGRQIGVLESGGRVVPETRLWDAGRGVTAPMRSKEEAHDYRYFPEPDLKPLVIAEEWIERVRAALPELPEARERRLESQYGLTGYDARVLSATRRLADWFESAARDSGDAKLAAHWVMNEVLRLLKQGNGDPASLNFSSRQMARMVKLMAEGVISGKIGKIVFEEMSVTGRDPETIIEEKGLSGIGGREALAALVADVIRENPGPVAEYLKGKDAAFRFLVGQAMNLSRGRAEPRLLGETLRDALDQRKGSG